MGQEQEETKSSHNGGMPGFTLLIKSNTKNVLCSSSVDNMIELMDIPRPISPVQSTSNLRAEIKQQQEEDVQCGKAATPKCVVK